MCLHLWNLYKEYSLEFKLNFLNFNLSLLTITNKAASFFFAVV